MLSLSLTSLIMAFKILVAVSVVGFVLVNLSKYSNAAGDKQGPKVTDKVK